MEKVVRARATNMSSVEKLVLTDLCVKYKNTIDVGVSRLAICVV